MKKSRYSQHSYLEDGELLHKLKLKIIIYKVESVPGIYPGE